MSANLTPPDALSPRVKSHNYLNLVMAEREVQARDPEAWAVLLDVNGRVAHLLLRMADDEGGDRITRKLTHHTIAQMIGSSRETVSRTMRNLVERGIIAVTRKDITLRDRHSLMLAARRA